MKRDTCVPKKLLCLSLLIGLLSPSPVAALEIRQERLHNNGVLVSRPHAEDMGLLSTLRSQGIHSLEDYERWLKTNIHYRKDELKDLWAAPLDTIGRGEGDCEDYAFLTAAVVRMLGYEPEVLAMTTSGQNGHAICVVKDGDYYHWFDNTHLQKTQARSLPELARIIFKVYKSTHLLKLDRDKGNWEPAFRLAS